MTGLRIAASIFALAGAACAEPVIELEITVKDAPDGFDLSCVTAVDVAGIGVGDEGPLDIGLRLPVLNERAPCVEIEPQTTLQGIREAIRGKISVAIPEAGLAALQLRGRAGTCLDTPNFHESIFYAGASYDGADQIALELTPNISCTSATRYRARPLDLLAITASPTHECSPVTDIDATFAGNVRPSQLAGAAPPLLFEGGRGVGILGVDGTVEIASFSGAAAGSCIALAHEGINTGGMTCANPSAPALCGTGIIEIPVLPYVSAGAVFDQALLAEYGSAVLGAVWERDPNQPIAGATVTASGDQSKVVYLEPRGTVLEVVEGATTTGASGMFLVYSRAVTNITATSPLHGSRTMIAGGGLEFYGTVLAVLAKR